MNKLEGKVALVTGGSRGIGAATAIRLAEEGADVAVTYARSAGAAEEVVARIKDLGRRALAIKADGTDIAAVEGLPSRVVQEFGRLDIIVNNAGSFTAAPLGDLSLESFRAEIALNLDAAFVLAKAALPCLKAGARFIAVGSTLGQRVPFPNLAAYSASKFAVQGLTRALARELGPIGIRCNCVQPGPIDTDMNPEDSEFADVQRAGVPLGRYGRPEEVAAAIAFLAGPDATYVNGAVLNVDGGFEA